MPGGTDKSMVVRTSKPWLSAPTTDALAGAAKTSAANMIIERIVQSFIQRGIVTA